MSTGDIISMVVKGFSATGPVNFVNTAHFIMDPGSTAPDLPGLSGNMRATYLAAMLAIMSASYAGSELKWTVVNGPNAGMQFIDPNWVGVAGALAGTAEDYAYAIIIRRYDAFPATRSGRGRMFIGPILNTVFNEAGLMVTPPAAIGAFETYQTYVGLDGTGQGYNPVLYNPTGPGVSFIVQGGHSERAGIRRHRRFKP